MDRVKVQSSNVASIGYDEKAKILEIEFHGGSIYQYSGVGKDVFDAFVKASSKGKFVYAHIRGKYTAIKIK